MHLTRTKLCVVMPRGSAPKILINSDRVYYLTIFAVTRHSFIGGIFHLRSIRLYTCAMHDLFMILLSANGSASISDAIRTLFWYCVVLFL